MEDVKHQIAKLVQSALSDAYVNSHRYIESDAWTNYRQDLRSELAKTIVPEILTAETTWARVVRNLIFIENRGELVDMINLDTKAELKALRESVSKMHEHGWV